MMPSNSDGPTHIAMDAARTFVNDILKEADRVKNDLLQPLKEFQQGGIVQHYFWITYIFKTIRPQNGYWKMLRT
jgi:hypothetical protein